MPSNQLNKDQNSVIMLEYDHVASVSGPNKGSRNHFGAVSRSDRAELWIQNIQMNDLCELNG